MGRRSRNRAPEPASAPPRPSRLDRFIDAGEERPKAPWHPFPLIELCVLVGIVLIVLGLFNTQDSEGRLMLLFGMVLASLAGLDTAVREHWSGFRSHSLLLAAVPMVLVAGTLFFTRVLWPLLLAISVGVFLGAFLYCRAVFRRASGGSSFKA